MPPLGMLLREDLTEHELLLLVAHDVAEIKEAISGNGQPGLLTRVAHLEGQGDNKTAAKGGMIGVAASLVLALAAKLLGVSL